MITLFQTKTLLSLKELKKRIELHLKNLPEQISLIGHSKKILRFEFSCEEIANLIGWLKNQRLDQKLYWDDRSQIWEMVGLGETCIVTGKVQADYQKLLTELKSYLSKDNPQLRFYGGFRFSEPKLYDNTWDNFNAYRFIIPRFEIVRIKKSYTFAYNIALNEITDEKISEICIQLDKLNFEPQFSETTLPEWNDRQDFPNQKEWEMLFNKTLNHLKLHDYEKIVLARKSVLNFSTEINPFTLVEQLKKNTPNCFHFCFSPQKEKAFLGASPERLYKRIRNDIKTEAIAGTRPRGMTQKEDNQLKEDLLHSPKDAKEHQFVVDFIHKSLNSICSELNKNKTPHTLKLNVGHHLITEFNGIINDTIEDYEIVTRLHPTPAVAGTPQKKALNYINKNEPFDRGLYASPIGYVGYDETEFIVAIRSGLIKNNQLSIYAGAGIVTDSRCEEEWNEIENKIGNFLKVL